MKDFQIAFPFQLDTRGRAAHPDWERHVRDMVELVLLTAPGERVNRPDFGCGLLEVIFSPETPDELSVLQHLAHAQLQRWLGDLITVISVIIDHQESLLDIRVEYRLIDSEQDQVATFELRDMPWSL